MKLISLNVALFEKNNDKLEDFIYKNQADIVCLQEITRKVDASADSDLVTYDVFKKNLPSLPLSFFGPIWQLNSFTAPNFHGSEKFVFELGGMVEFGNLTQTKFPITYGENQFIQENYALITDWSKVWGNEPRALLITDLRIEEKMLRIINYHGIWSRDKQGTDRTLRASEKIIEITQSVNYPSVICGDLNLFPDTKSIQILSQDHTNLCDMYNIKTTRPATNELSDKTRNVVDYVFVSEGIKVNHFEVLDTNVSDHLPLALDFELL